MYFKKTFLAFKNGVKSIQTAGYNGARTVYFKSNQQQPGENLRTP